MVNSREELLRGKVVRPWVDPENRQSSCPCNAVVSALSSHSPAAALWQPCYSSFVQVEEGDRSETILLDALLLTVFYAVPGQKTWSIKFHFRKEIGMGVEGYNPLSLQHVVGV